MTAPLFLLAAALGALVRWRVARLGWGWIGTLVVNTVGAFALGWMVAADVGPTAATVVGTGFLGSLTTFSTFTLEATDGGATHRLVVAASTLALGLTAAALGWTLA